MTEPVHTSSSAPEITVTSATVTATEAPAEQGAAPTPAWEDVFKGQDPREVQRALENSRKWEERAKANVKAAEKLKEIEDRDLSDLEKARRDAETAQQKLTEYERTTLRQRIALEKGLPASLVVRLQGTTEDEVSADADQLLALIKSPTGPRPDPSQGARPVSPAAEADAEYERFYPSTPTTRK